jgi:Tfp pilus assembly ATPase PilU
LSRYFEEKVADLVQKTENTAVGILSAVHSTSFTAKVDTNFANKRRSLGRYSSRTQAMKFSSLFLLVPYQFKSELPIFLLLFDVAVNWFFLTSSIATKFQYINSL